MPTVLNAAMTITRAGGAIGIPGLYVTDDPGGVDQNAKRPGRLPSPAYEQHHHYAVRDIESQQPPWHGGAGSQLRGIQPSCHERRCRQKDSGRGQPPFNAACLVRAGGSPKTKQKAVPVGEKGQSSPTLMVLFSGY